MRPPLTRILPILCASSIALVGGYLSPISSAQACDCRPMDITESYSTANQVFTGQILFSLELVNTKLYLAWIHETYKGCAPKNPIRWIETDLSDAGCGSRFSIGEYYLIHASPGSGLLSFATQTHSCAGNRAFNRLTPSELEFLNTRNNCCGDECSCVGGDPIAQCAAEPCDMIAPCEGEGAVECVQNFCGGCNAEFFNKDGKRVCTDPVGPRPCVIDDDCEASQYCGFDNTCANDTTCKHHGECDLPGNAFEVEFDCWGYGLCLPNNECSLECGDPSCADHTGYDFGDCEMVVGWVRKGDECVFVPSGCGSLISNREPFASKRDCEERCALEPTTFACGDKLHCDSKTSFCLESTPGMEPPPGAPTRYFDCEPLPSNCADSPSCETCFNVNENSMIVEGELATGTCTRSDDGFITVDIAYP